MLDSALLDSAPPPDALAVLGGLGVIAIALFLGWWIFCLARHAAAMRESRRKIQ